MGKADVIASVCRSVGQGDTFSAASILRRDYPFAPEQMTQRRYTALASTRVFVRDGFIDRYTGERLVFPPVLRALSLRLPAEFPFHPNWKTDVTHPAFWEIGATIDHLVPVSRGGADEESNWITTSMARNSAKMNWTLDELGWSLHPPGVFAEWDGLLRWFVDFAIAEPQHANSSSLRQWRAAATKVLAEQSSS